MYGAIIGAIIVNYGKTFFTGAFPEIWLFMLGAVFVVTTMYLPTGVVGAYENYFGKDKKKNQSTDTDGSESKDIAEQEPAQ